MQNRLRLIPLRLRLRALTTLSPTLTSSRTRFPSHGQHSDAATEPMAEADTLAWADPFRPPLAASCAEHADNIWYAACRRC